MSKRSAAVKREVSSPITMEDEGRSKRRRVPTSRFDFQFLDNEEQRYLQQAIKISKIDKKREEMMLEMAPTYHPTLEEFTDCMAYITKIRPEAERYGICKIVPPEGWNPPHLINMTNNKTFETKRQKVNTLQEGQGFDDGGQYTAATYKDMADAFYESWTRDNYTAQDRKLPTEEELEKKYWDVVETSASQVTVDYGNDIDSTIYGSGFLTGGSRVQMAKYIRNPDFGDPEYYRQSTWNLNNVPSAPGSVLTYVKTPINGINVPWLYFGMLFASFCWHNEDNYFYSINYNHTGAAKQWYGVPGSAADLFEKVSKEFLLGLFRETPDLLHHMTTQISPRLLTASGVPVYKSTQEAGSFIVTFPKAFHCGFSYGFNCAEAVNFATSDWITAGAEAEERYRLFGRESVFSYQRLLFTLLQNVTDMKVGVRSLISETRRILNEEIELRAFALDKGVKDLSQLVAIPPNDFSTINEKATEYDDMRTCGICHQVCVLSAVGCECDMKRVACLRHFLSICKCAHEKKFLIEWAPRDQLHRMKSIEVSKTKSTDK